MYQGLKHLYNTPNEELIKTSENFHDICRKFYTIVKEYSNQTCVRLYEEIYGDDVTAHIVDTNNSIIVMKHYHIRKIIPLE